MKSSQAVEYIQEISCVCLKEMLNSKSHIWEIAVFKHRNFFHLFKLLRIKIAMKNTLNKHLFASLSVIILFGCNNYSNCEGCGAHIWDDKSQRIKIIKSGGLLPTTQTFDYVRDTLPESANQKLNDIRVNNTNLECWNDAFTYDIVITDESGVDHNYFSNNKACVDVDGKDFVDTLLVEELISLL
jgi:hypothetical protein